MGLVAEFEIHCEALPLVEVAEAAPAAAIEVEIQFNHGNRPPFIVHVTHDSPDAVERALESSSFVATYTVLGQAGETRRYQVIPAVGIVEQLGDHVDLSGLRALATTDSSIDRIRATPTGWIQTGWFADRDAFHEFRRFWQKNAGFTLRRLGRVGEPEEPGDGLTDPQREALRTAYEMGHYRIPRAASLEAVADELEISPSSLSERLRRAQTHLIETTVASIWPPLPE
ncbi:DNA-binding protein [Halostagnicola larsenii XH-48]|uniref:DNA-binding protein n=1 Tax=Halostagnicola larsenii XH-48 TaxID=797299 RepID=W0JRQ6_9EURY|nr:helix-turn-helix domain-containing protein [Halostagnicola larsenii]AHF99844.1 DNA-binding protein [Halostagnicola larsenii XH-48]